MLNANGYRDEESKPALAVVIKARTAAIPSIINPSSPKKTSAPRDIGIRELVKALWSSNPMVTKTTSMYKAETIIHAKKIPSGIFLFGWHTSSATLHTFVSPINETNTKPAVAKIDPKPCVIIGWNLLGSI